MYIKNHLKEKMLFRSRVWVLISVIIFLSGLLLSRLVYLQLIEHHRYTTMSRNNRISLQLIAPNRGLIFDRNGVLLAKNKLVDSLEVIPANIRGGKKAINQLLQSLQKILPISQAQILHFKKRLMQHRAYERVSLIDKLSEVNAARFYVNRYRFPGVFVRAHMIRVYPMNDVMAPVVGYVGHLTDEDLQKVDASNYGANEFIGKTGIEQAQEANLHGTTGYQEVEINADGRPVRFLKRVPPTSGKNIYLSIDSRLQSIAMKALAPFTGALVAIDPETGQVLAMASTPSFDPNWFVSGISQKKYDMLSHSVSHPLFNRAVHGQFPFGSTIKPFEALFALDNQVITPDFTIEDPGYFRLPHNDHVYHDWKIGGHGLVNVSKAIIVSCDTFFYELGLKMGMPMIDSGLKQFGFGEKTQVGLLGERSGILASPAWKSKHIGERWYSGDTIISSIGQGYMLATPMQLAFATAILANRGVAYQPTLINKIVASAVDKNSALVEEVKPVAKMAVLLHHPEVWGWVIRAMQGVIDSVDPRGVGLPYGRHPSYTIAGKTGTAQVDKPRKYQYKPNYSIPFKYRDHALFVAFAPVERPKIALAIILEHAELRQSLKVARKVVDAYLLKISKTPRAHKQ